MKRKCVFTLVSQRKYKHRHPSKAFPENSLIIDVYSNNMVQDYYDDDDDNDDHDHDPHHDHGRVIENIGRVYSSEALFIL